MCHYTRNDNSGRRKVTKKESVGLREKQYRGKFEEADCMERRRAWNELLTCVPYVGLDYFGVHFNDSGVKIHSKGTA